MPKALYVQLYQLLYDSEYDHAGVIVEDKYGEPYIFERNLFFGYNMVQYETRMNECNAYQIMVIPLVVSGKSDSLTTENTRKLMTYASTASNTSAFRDAEAYLFSRSLFRRVFSSASAYCPNITLLMSFFHECDIRVSCSDGPPAYGINSVLEKAVQLRPAQSGVTYKLGPNIMIKTE